MALRGVWGGGGGRLYIITTHRPLGLRNMQEMAARLQTRDPTLPPSQFQVRQGQGQGERRVEEIA